jgi:hypothetical protein
MWLAEGPVREDVHRSETGSLFRKTGHSGSNDNEALLRRAINQSWSDSVAFLDPTCG